MEQKEKIAKAETEGKAAQELQDDSLDQVNGGCMMVEPIYAEEAPVPKENGKVTSTRKFS